MATKFRFKLLEGKHAEEDAVKVYKKGDVVESFSNLAEKFPGRFELVGEKAPEKVEDEKIKIKIKPKATETELQARGDEVTKDFKTVDPKLFQVFKREKLFHVFEVGKTSPLNPAGLKADAVEKFCTDYLEQ